MSFLQPLLLAALPLMTIPIIIHLINQWRYQTKPWGAMQFLLAANRMNRGFARIRRWLILAMRTLAIAGLILAVARPLASGLLGLAGGGSADTTIILMDRSPSMQQQGIGGLSKLETGRRQLADALDKLGSKHWVAVDAADATARSYDSLEALLDSPATSPCSATSNLAAMMQATLEYLQTNKPGPTEVWICSDLRASDWNADSGTWGLVRDGFEQLPQSVRFNLVAYPDQGEQNIALRVTDVRREVLDENNVRENVLLLSMQLSRSGSSNAEEPVDIPVFIEIEGARTEIVVRMNGTQTELRNQPVPLGRNQELGWGKVSVPADFNNADNEYYFVFADEAPRRIVIVSEDRSATRALEIAAGITATGETNAVVDIITPQQLDSLLLDDTALLLWQTSLPDDSTSPAVESYVAAGGRVIFFPPTSLVNDVAVSSFNGFLGVGWDRWERDQRVMVDNWRGDQDLLSSTMSGTGLPLGQLQIDGYARLRSEVVLSSLATLTGGAPLVAKLPTDRGGVYFFTASADPAASSLAENGIVLFVAVQRAIEAGLVALGNTTQRTAEATTEPTADWRKLAGPIDALSTEFSLHRGVYETEDRLFAVNRPSLEDRREQLEDAKIEQLFAGLPFARVDDSAGSLSGIVREVWRTFLILMILALLLEAALCIPRATPVRANAKPA